MRFVQKLECALFLAIVALLLFWAAGCVETLPPETKAKIDAIQNQEKVDAANAKAKIDALEQQAKAKPTLHALEFSNLVVQDIRGPLTFIGVVSTVLFFLAVGLWIAGNFIAILGGLLTTIAKLAAPIAGTVAVGSWVTLWLAPLFFWVLGGTAILALTIFLIQLAKAHWDVRNLFCLHVQNENAIKQATGVDPKLLAAGITDVKSPSVVGAP